MEVRFSFSGAECVAGALEPERTFREDRAKISLGKEKGSLVLKMEARDDTSLRAAVNSYVRLIDASHRCLEVL